MKVQAKAVLYHRGTGCVGHDRSHYIFMDQLMAQPIEHRVLLVLNEYVTEVRPRQTEGAYAGVSPRRYIEFG